MEGRSTRTNSIVIYDRYKAHDGVHAMTVSQNQADYLNSFSPNARLVFLAFTHVDGTDGIGNGIARKIMSFVKVWEDVEYLVDESYKEAYASLREDNASLREDNASLREEIASLRERMHR